jgi:pyridoxal phosphate enzyme (YggS family)
MNEKYTSILNKINNKAILIAVSKFRSESEIMELYDQGQRHFGENKVQELVSKYETLPKDIQWHFIGNLQRNKVKYIAPFIHCIHSVENEQLASEIDKQAQKHNRKIPCLIQFHIAEETTKQGFYFPVLCEILQKNILQQYSNINWIGIMAMASNTNNTEQIRKEFQILRSYFIELKNTFFKTEKSFNEISMGMSNDYEIALREGTTMLRIGSLLFN